MDKRERVMKGLEACSMGIDCGPNCPYEEILKSPGMMGNCISVMARDALELLKAQTPFGNASCYADPTEGQYSGLIAEE